MGQFNKAADNTVQYLTLPNASDCGDACVYATPGYHNGTVYIAYGYGPLMALPLANGLFNANAQAIAVPSSLSTELYEFPSPSPSISASPAGNALVWVLDNSLYQGNANAPAGAAILRAYDASNLGTTLYSSATLGADAAGNAVKFTVPVIANGHVYVGGRAAGDGLRLWLHEVPIRSARAGRFTGRILHNRLITISHRISPKTSYIQSRIRYD